MRVLVVDDQKLKVEQAKKIVSKILPDATFRSAKNFLRAISMLEGYSWDLVILDMSFSVNDSPSEYSGFEGLAGIQVLQYLFRSDIKTKVIIFSAHTQFEDQYLSVGSLEDLDELVRNYFEDLYLGCIFSMLSESELERSFRKLIDKLKDTNIEAH